MFQLKNRYLFMVLLGGYSYLNSYFSEVYRYYPIPVAWYWVLLCFIVITAVVWESNRWMQGIVLKQKNVPRLLSKLHPLLLFFLAGTLVSTLLSSLAILVIAKLVVGLNDAEWALPFKLALTFGTRINLFLHCINAIFFFLKQYRKKELEAEELKRASTQAELQAIKNQVNPHFLFNNLNVLSSLVMKDHQDANKFVEAFSQVYRHILNQQEKELIPFREEMAFMKPYIFLLEKRFSEGIQVEMNVPEKYQEWLILPVSLQMLVENAIKHNIVSRNKPLKISFSVNGTDTLIVKNNLQPKTSEEPSTKVGLNNISRRYEMTTGRKVKVVQDAEWFSVFLPLIEPLK